MCIVTFTILVSNGNYVVNTLVGYEFAFDNNCLQLSEVSLDCLFVLIFGFLMLGGLAPRIFTL